MVGPVTPLVPSDVGHSLSWPSVSDTGVPCTLRWMFSLCPDYEQETCARVYDILRTKDPEAASLLGECLSWDGQKGDFDDMINTIIERSADAALLEQTLRPLGEKLFSHEVSSYCGCGRER